MRCVESVYTVRNTISAVGALSMWCEEKVCIMRNVTSAVQREKVCGIWNGRICKQKAVQCEEKV